jgi:hypothetical protein
MVDVTAACVAADAECVPVKQKYSAQQVSDKIGAITMFNLLPQLRQKIRDVSCVSIENTPQIVNCYKFTLLFKISLFVRIIYVFRFVYFVHRINIQISVSQS